MPPKVCINYEVTGVYNGTPYRSIVTDEYPVAGSCAQPGAVVVTVPMRGEQLDVESVTVKTSKIPDNQKRYNPVNVPPGVVNGVYGSNSPGGRAWWLRNYTPLKELNGVGDLIFDVAQDNSDLPYSARWPNCSSPKNTRQESWPPSVNKR